MRGRHDSVQEEVWPGREWAGAAAAEVGLDAARLGEAAAYAGGAGMIIRGGRVACAWGDTRAVHHIQSATKALGATALGLAIADGKMRLDDPALHHHAGLGVPPEENRRTGWLELVTIAQLAQMTAGFGKDGGYTELLFRPGSGWAYLRRGRWSTSTLLPATFIDAVRTTSPGVAGLPVVNDPLRRFGGASAHYGLLWWNNGDAAIGGLPADAYWAWGLGDAIILVIPSLDMVVARVGPAFPGDRSPSYYRALAPFILPVASACSHRPPPSADA